MKQQRINLTWIIQILTVFGLNATAVNTSSQLYWPVFNTITSLLYYARHLIESVMRKPKIWRILYDYYDRKNGASSMAFIMELKDFHNGIKGLKKNHYSKFFLNYANNHNFSYDTTFFEKIPFIEWHPSYGQSQPNTHFS